MIPVLLMLVCPGPGYPGPAQALGQRASDADRDIAADILGAAAADGRLTLDELDDRLAAALAARTITELAALIPTCPAAGARRRRPGRSIRPPGPARRRPRRRPAGGRSFRRSPTGGPDDEGGVPMPGRRRPP